MLLTCRRKFARASALNNFEFCVFDHAPIRNGAYVYVYAYAAKLILKISADREFRIRKFGENKLLLMFELELASNSMRAEQLRLVREACCMLLLSPVLDVHLRSQGELEHSRFERQNEITGFN